MSHLCRGAAFFFIVILSGSICGGQSFLRIKNFDRGNVLDLIPFCSLLFFFPSADRDDPAGLERNLFMILYYFMLPLSPLPLSTRKTTRANKNSTFTQSAIIYSESTRSEKQLHTRRSRQAEIVQKSGETSIKLENTSVQDSKLNYIL